MARRWIVFEGTRTGAVLYDVRVESSTRPAVVSSLGRQPGARLRAFTLAALVVAASLGARGAERTPAATAAYDDYVTRAQAAFVERALRGGEGFAVDARATLLRGGILAKPGRDDGITEVPDALVHHWAGAVFLEHVTLDRVLTLSRAYEDYPKVFTFIKGASVLEHDADTYRLRLRMRASAGGISATIDNFCTVRYTRIGVDRAYVVSTSDQVREVRDAGHPNETLLPEGRDSGYLWRATTLTRFAEHDDGVLMEMETIGLSRRFPAMLGWLIEPVARRLGRRSVSESVSDFRTAVRQRTAPDRAR